MQGMEKMIDKLHKNMKSSLLLQEKQKLDCKI